MCPYNIPTLLWPSGIPGKPTMEQTRVQERRVSSYFATSLQAIAPIIPVVDNPSTVLAGRPFSMSLC